MKIKSSDIFVAIVVICIILMIILPISTFLLDILLIVNIAASLLILLVAMYTEETLQFSVFPTLLLIITVFRLALTVSSTKLILNNQGDAGKVISTFGDFVIGGNIVVGLIVFLIIIAIQFIVITKGAERVAEVAARFTLDAMPGKQMAIDADLNSGVIDEDEARTRRDIVQRESDFYGSMDGASKFVKGDAIMGIITTIINIVGGLIIGILMFDMPAGDAVEVYTLATVGDGLVTQIPALLVSTSMGIIVTRAASTGSLGTDLTKQLLGRPLALIICGGVLLFMNLVPGFPKLPLIIIGVGFIALGLYLYNMQRQQDVVEDEVDVTEELAEEKRKPESIATLLQVDPIELEFGYGILPLVDTSQGGDLLDRVVMIRRQCALDLGIIVPSIRLRDNIQLKTNEYVIKIKGVEVAKGEVMSDHYLALNATGEDEQISGIKTTEPAFGLPALWITKAEREKADLLGYTTIDPPSVIATHLTEIIKRHGHELLSRQQVQTLLENLEQQQPALVEEVVPKMFSLGEVQKILANLLRENVPIRDMVTIIETLGDYGNLTRDPEMLTEYVRQNLSRAITRRFVPDDIARAITLDPNLEQLIADRIKQTERGSYVALDPEQLQGVFNSLKVAIDRITSLGMTPIVLTSPVIRRFFKRITEQMVPDLVVLSYNELEQGIDVHSEGVVSI